MKWKTERRYWDNSRLKRFRISNWEFHPRACLDGHYWARSLGTVEPLTKLFAGTFFKREGTPKGQMRDLTLRALCSASRLAYKNHSVADALTIQFVNGGGKVHPIGDFYVGKYW